MTELRCTRRGWTRLGIIAGAGALPVTVASCDDAYGRAGKAPFVVRLTGIADRAFPDLETRDCGLGEAGKLIRLLKDHGCDAVCLAGIVARPDFTALKLDLKGARLLPKVIKAAAIGDGALLDVLVETLEQEGFRVVGAHEIAGHLAAGEGILGRYRPSDENRVDIEKAAKLIDALGPFDVGQGAVVAGGHVLAIEAVEGTDAMLARCAQLAQGDGASTHSGPLTKRRGVLVKRPKPGQELRVDLPTIGPETVRLADAAGLAGIAFVADRALIMDREKTIERADAAGLFLYGMTPDDQS